jgi:hypothetical protein
MDESWLPLPKAEMKTVLKIAIAAERDETRRDWLRGGWVLLSEFQPNIGDEPVSCDLPEKPTPEALKTIERYMSVAKQAQAEREQSMLELKEFLATLPN